MKKLMNNLNLRFISLSKTLIVFVVIYSNLATAACNSTNCTGLIYSMILVEAGVYVAMSEDTSAVNCTAVAGVYFFLPAANLNYNSIYSGMLVAATTTTEINLAFLENSPNCEILGVVASFPKAVPPVEISSQ